MRHSFCRPNWVSERTSHRSFLTSVLFKQLQLYQFYPTVFGAAGFRGVVGQGFSLAETGGLKAAGGNARLGKLGHYGTGAVIGKLLITGWSTYVIGVALHSQTQLRVLAKQHQDFRHGCCCLGPQRGLIRVEVQVEGNVAFRI